MLKKWNSKYKPFIVIYSLPLKFSPLNTVHKSHVHTIRDVEIVWYIHVGIPSSGSGGKLNKSMEISVTDILKYKTYMGIIVFT